MTLPALWPASIGELAAYVGSAAAVDDLTLLLISRDRAG